MAATEAEEAISALAADPALLREAVRLEPEIRADALRRAGEEGVGAVIGEMESVFAPPPMSVHVKASWWRLYIDALSDLPMASLLAAERAWMRSEKGQFMPKPGELRALALQAPSRAAEAARRIKAAAAEAERRAKAVRKPVDRAQLNLSMAEWRAAMAAKAATRTRDAKPSAPTSPICASTGETGVSDELRRMVRGEEAAP